MPVKSSTSSIFRWPDATEVHAALEEWAVDAVVEQPELLRAGLIGSYARGDWGVGSDADVILIVDSSPLPFIERAREWDLTALPVPADVLVYTADEWTVLRHRRSRFAETVAQDAIWVVSAAAEDGGESPARIT